MNQIAKIFNPSNAFLIGADFLGDDRTRAIPNKTEKKII